MKRVVVVHFLFLSSYLCGGAISGGGAGLTTFLQNPWFIENTETVYYCINQDQQNFSLDPKVAEQKISDAFQYYKTYFSQWGDNNKLVGKAQNKSFKMPFELGTQDFVKLNACNGSEDIEFKLGAVDQKLLNTVKNPSFMAGVTILGSYDQKKLKGKGVIYIGADRGPHRMKSFIFDVHKNPWNTCNSVNFYHALIHELGHVFGLKHSSNERFMDASIVEKSISHKWNRDQTVDCSNEAASSNNFSISHNKSFQSMITYNRRSQIFYRRNDRNKNIFFPVRKVVNQGTQVLLKSGNSVIYFNDIEIFEKGEITLVLPKSQRIKKTKIKYLSSYFHSWYRDVKGVIDDGGVLVNIYGNPYASFGIERIKYFYGIKNGKIAEYLYIF